MTQEEENVIFMRMLKKYGAIELERMMAKRIPYKHYYRRWPFDGKVMPADIEKVQDFLPSVGPSPEETMVMEQAAKEYMDRLTPKEQGVAQKLVEGYKPRDIARMEGKKNSGSIRWLKHNIKTKFERSEK